MGREKPYNNVSLIDKENQWLTCVYDDVCGDHESAGGDLGGVCGVYGGDCDCDH